MPVPLEGATREIGGLPLGIPAAVDVSEDFRGIGHGDRNYHIGRQYGWRTIDLLCTVPENGPDVNE
ncbi:hypothetical protein D3C83_258690 [compost metagenome]